MSKVYKFKPANDASHEEDMQVVHCVTISMENEVRSFALQGTLLKEESDVWMHEGHGVISFSSTRERSVIIAAKQKLQERAIALHCSIKKLNRKEY